MTLCDHVINRLCDFVDNRPALEPTTWSTLVAIGLAEVEIYRFSSARDQLITCSKRQKTQSMAVLTINLYSLLSLAVIDLVEVEIYCFLFIT